MASLMSAGGTLLRPLGQNFEGWAQTQLFAQAAH